MLFFEKNLPKKLGREKPSKKNPKRQYSRRNLWSEITTNFPLKKNGRKKSSKNNLKRKYLRRNLWREKSSKKNPTVFTKKSLKRNHYQFSFEKNEEKNRRKIIWRESIYEEIFEEKNLPNKIRQYSRRNLWREITTNFPLKKMEEKKSSKNNLKRKYLRRNLWREKSSNKNLKRQYFRRNLWREITTNFPLKKRKLEGKNREKTIWRESIYEVIFEEKSLSKDFWKIIYQRNLEEKNLPKKTDETVFTIFFLLGQLKK